MKRRLVIAALVALGLGSPFLFVRAFVPVERFILGVAAAGPTEALLLTRRNEDHSTRFWLEHVDVAGELRWSAELSPLEPWDTLGFTSVAAADDRVIVLGMRGADMVALALDRTSGRHLWETVLPRTPSTSGRIGPTVLIDGPRVYLVRESLFIAGLADRVDALSLADGATLWTSEPDLAAHVHLLAPDRLLINPMGKAASVRSGATGEVVTRLELTHVVCAIPDGLLASHSGRPMLVPAAADQPLWRAGPDAPWHIWSGPCGVRGEDPVLPVRFGGGPNDSTGLVRIDRQTGLPRWQIDLGQTQPYELLTLDGRLPRFLPVSSSSARGGALNELVIVDLDAGVVVRRAEIADHIEVVATAERAWLWLQFKNTLAGLDPATGLLTSATAFDGLSSPNIRREDLQFGALWLHGAGLARPAALPWAAVDLATSEVLRTAASIVPRDQTAKLRAMLGG